MKEQQVPFDNVRYISESIKKVWITAMYVYII